MTHPDPVWGPYPNYDDIARFEYGRLLWRNLEMRARLLTHWLDPRHPYRDRFLASRPQLESILESTDSAASLQDQLLARGTSLRCLAREIPPVFGSFFAESRSAGPPVG
jgi:hypothetical protein